MSSQNILKTGSKKSNSPEETKALGFSFGKTLTTPAIIALYGDLGAGKTTLIKGIASGYADISEDTVQSPTFTLQNTYNGIKTIHHFDLYRLKSEDDFITRGFEDLLFTNDLIIIEWAERIEQILPKNTVKITLNDTGSNSRTIEVA